MHQCKAGSHGDRGRRNLWEAPAVILAREGAKVAITDYREKMLIGSKRDRDCGAMEQKELRNSRLRLGIG